MHGFVLHVLMPVVSAVLSVLLHLYVYRAVRRVVRLEGRARIAVLVAVIAAGVGLPAAGRIAYLHPTGVIGAAGLVAWVWLISVCYVFFAVAAFDLARLAVRGLRRFRRRPAASREPADPGRRVLAGRIALAGAGLLAGGASAKGLFNAQADPETTDITIPLRGLGPGPGVTLVHLTDIHIGAHFDAARVRRIVDLVNALRPDLVALSGDVVDRDGEAIERGVAELARLRAPLGTFACLGNHEYWADPDRSAAWLAAANVRVLRNARAAVATANGPLDVLGVDDHWAARLGEGQGPDLAAAVAGRDPSCPAVLLCHQPRDFDRCGPLGIGLQLSGHLHGGQIFPVAWFQRFGYDWLEGLRRDGRAYLYVGRGVGTVGPPLRILSDPEVTRIRLVPEVV